MPQIVARILQDRILQTLLLVAAFVCAWIAYENSLAALEISRATACQIDQSVICESLDEVIRQRAILPEALPVN